LKNGFVVACVAVILSLWAWQQVTLLFVTVALHRRRCRQWQNPRVSALCICLYVYDAWWPEAMYWLLCIAWVTYPRWHILCGAMCSHHACRKKVSVPANPDGDIFLSCCVL
jgi:hypothetical protein